MKFSRFDSRLAFSNDHIDVLAKQQGKRIDMYEQHFGFIKRPFPAQATGSDVFVGPQTAKTMSGFRKALAAQDAVVTVSGPVGTGKTTLVHRALQGMGTKYKTIRVGRMEMKSSDVLESLLIVLGVKDRPAGTIQRFAALRRKLRELQDTEVRVFIVIEDALRTGTETLAELEALTAADAGDSDGASIVVMGDERLPDFMQNPEVAQLQQRVRQRHTISPLSAAELRAYLIHGFRMAGADFEHISGARSAELLHQLSNGIPRIVNNLVEAALVTAADQGLDNISATLIAKVAADEFGLSVENFDFSIPQPEPVAEATPAPAPEPPPEPAPEPVLEVAPEPAPEPQAEPELKVAPEPAPEPVLEAAPEPAPEPVVDVVPESQPEPAAEAAPEPAKVDETQPAKVLADVAAEPSLDPDDIPHLIQDTLPDLKTLAPQFAKLPDEETKEAVDPVAERAYEFESVTEIVPELVPEPEPRRDLEPAAELIPELELEPEPVAENAAEAEVKTEAVVEERSDDEVPEWDRDPTLAELKPDLDALEQAMAFVHGVSVEKTGEPPVETEAISDDVGEKEEMPEITLDKSIETGIDNLLIEDPDGIKEARRTTKSAVELDQIAREIGNAKSLDDIDDKMAETLFGSGISMIAAQLRASQPKDESANDAIQLEPDIPELEPDTPQLEPDIPELEPEVLAPSFPADAEVGEEISLESNETANKSGADLTATQRLKMVRGLNASSQSRQPGTNGGAESQAANTPKPIEDQINTSITQTLKALEVPREPEAERETERKTGFFSRFRRS
jgi:type II secretory pathway predicted ATPase ExeA